MSTINGEDNMQDNNVTERSSTPQGGSFEVIKYML